MAFENPLLAYQAAFNDPMADTTAASSSGTASEFDAGRFGGPKTAEQQQIIDDNLGLIQQANDEYTGYHSYIDTEYDALNKAVGGNLSQEQYDQFITDWNDSETAYWDTPNDIYAQTDLDRNILRAGEEFQRKDIDAAYPDATEEERDAIWADVQQQNTANQTYQQETKAQRDDMIRSLGFVVDPEASGMGYGVSPDGQWGFFNGEIHDLRADGWDTFGQLVKAGTVGFLGMGLGAAAAPVVGATSGAATGAIQGGLSSALGGAIEGNLDVGDILTGALTGGITGGFGDLASAGSLGNSLDNAIWDVSGVTGLDYDTVSEIMGGVASGAVQGQDLEDILMTAAGTAAGNLGKGWLNETLGQSGLDVDNWFKEGTTNINTEALGTIAENLGDAAGAGKIDIGDVGSGLLDYIEAGGSLGFADPDIKLPNVGGSLPDVDFSKGDWGITQDADGNYTVSGNADFLPDGGLNFPAGTDLGYIEDAIREAGREFDDAVVQPVLEAGREFDDAVLQPIKDALPQGTTPDNPFSTPDNPFSTPELPSIDLPDVGLSSGTGTTPTDKEWSKLFGYTKITPYQKKQLAPYVDYIKQAKGMLS